MAVNLTEHGYGEAQDSDLKPVLQVTDIRLVNTQQETSSERYRILLSDGAHLNQGILATQINYLVKNGGLQKGSIVQLMQFVCTVIQGRMIIIIIDLDVILEKCDPIGEPTQYTQGGNTGFLYQNKAIIRNKLLALTLHTEQVDKAVDLKSLRESWDAIQRVAEKSKEWIESLEKDLKLAKWTAETNQKACAEAERERDELREVVRILKSDYDVAIDRAREEAVEQYRNSKEFQVYIDNQIGHAFNQGASSVWKMVLQRYPSFDTRGFSKEDLDPKIL